MNDTNNEKLYRSSDLGLTAFLYTIGHQILTIDKTDPKRAMLVFKKTSRLESDLEDYYARNGRVNPTDYFNAIRDLKSRIYEKN